MSRIPFEGTIKYEVEVASGAAGVNVAVSPSEDTVIVPAIGCPVLVGATKKVAFVTVNGSIRLLK